MWIFNQYLSFSSTIKEIDDDSGDRCNYKCPSIQSDDENYYEPQNQMNNIVEKVITKDCICILTPQDHQKLMINEKYICLLTNRGINSVNILCWDKFDSSLWRYFYLKNFIMRMTLTYFYGKDIKT